MSIIDTAATQAKENINADAQTAAGEDILYGAGMSSVFPEDEEAAVGTGSVVLISYRASDALVNWWLQSASVPDEAYGTAWVQVRKTFPGRWRSLFWCENLGRILHMDGRRKVVSRARAGTRCMHGASPTKPASARLPVACCLMSCTAASKQCRAVGARTLDVRAHARPSYRLAS